MKFILPLLAIASLAVVSRAVFKIIIPRRIRARYRVLAEEHLPYRIGECLGLGRSGVVYEMIGDKSDPGSPERVIKLAHAAKAQRSATTTSRMNKIKDALAPSKAAAAGAIAPILEAGEFRVGPRRVPYQIYRRARGETFEAMIRSGEVARMPLREVIRLLLRILNCAALLEEDGLYFIHLDAANVMIDSDSEAGGGGGGNGKPCLIDPDELESGPLSPKRRKRYLRRVCRLVLEAVEEKGAEWKKLKGDENVKRFVDRLDLHRKTPKGRTIPECDRFDSLGEIQEGLEELKTRSEA